jgi:hypothetical protein
MHSLLWTIAALCVCASRVTAQNCSQTSIGEIPLDQLGASTYQGFQGGLYPGGANTIPEAHRIGGLAEACAVVPRNASGAPAANGKIVLLSIGMSNCSQEFSRFVAIANADPLKHPRVQAVNGAQGGQTASIIQNPDARFWTVVDERLAQANATREQVQVIWFKDADSSPTSGFPAYAETLKDEFVAILQVIRDRFPNARLCYLASRIYAGYATTALNPEPYAYEQAFSVKWTIEDQIAGAAALNYDPSRGAVEAPWLAWGTYNWADGLIPGADGLTWACSDFQSDGTHPSMAGANKVANRLANFLRTEPTAASWYLRAPPPASFGTGTAALSWIGSPSLLANDFALSFTGAVPGGIGFVVASAAPDAAPFFGGTLYVGAPRRWLRAGSLDWNGAGTVPIAIGAADVGTTRFYQGYFRLGLVAPSAGVLANGAVLSDALRVVFHP